MGSAEDGASTFGCLQGIAPFRGHRMHEIGSQISTQMDHCEGWSPKSVVLSLMHSNSPIFEAQRSALQPTDLSLPWLSQHPDDPLGRTAAQAL